MDGRTGAMFSEQKNTPTMDQLISACDALFGSGVKVSYDFIKTLQPSGIKSAYRKRAMETHPDRAKINGCSPMNEASFETVTNAYRMLISSIKGNHIVITPPRSREKDNTPPVVKQTLQKDPGRKPVYYAGQVPNRELLLGQFLYYSRLISWQALIRAIAWQKRLSPKMGQIALKWGLLSENQITYILKNKPFGERFGDFALRHGLLTHYHLFALLGKQRLSHRKIGDYFIGTGNISPFLLRKMALKQLNHNRALRHFSPWE